MPVRVYTIGFDVKAGVFHDEELSKFLLNKEVKRLEPTFFQSEGRPFWSVYIEYEDVLKPDQFTAGQALNDAQRLLYHRLRAWRKERADKDGIPVFLIATNAELIAVIEQRPRSLEALKEIRGFGNKKIARYGQEILDLLAAFYEKTPLHAMPKNASPSGRPPS